MREIAQEYIQDREQKPQPHNEQKMQSDYQEQIGQERGSIKVRNNKNGHEEYQADEKI